MRKFLAVLLSLMMIFPVVLAAPVAAAIQDDAGAAARSPAIPTIRFRGMVTLVDGTGPLVNPIIGMEAYAYRQLAWDASAYAPESYPTEGDAVAENLVFFPDTTGVQVAFGGFSLTLYRWIDGGDRRVYSGGTGIITEDGVQVLRLTNARFSMDNNYATAAMVGNGWGTIDLAASNAALVAELDPSGTGQVQFSYTGAGQEIQAQYGRYSFDLTLGPADHTEAITSQDVTATGQLDFTDEHVSFNIHSFAPGGPPPSPDQRAIFVSQIMSNPGGSAPLGISGVMTGGYWEIGTVLSAINTDVTFDLNGLGVPPATDLRLLKRETSADPWQVVANQDPVDDLHIRANGLTSFSEFALGEVTTHSLMISVIGSGTTEPPSGSYPYGTSVRIRAYPETGWEFSGWTGNTATIASTGSADTTIVMDADYTIAANFVEILPTPVHNISTGEDFTTIQAAIDDANTVNGNVITVDAGTYAENLDFAGKNITLRSVNGAASTIIDGGHAGSVVRFVSGETSNAVLDGFTLTNGTGTLLFGSTIQRYGGGIVINNGSNPTITNCIINGNSAQAGGGGGIAVWYSSATIANSIITGNQSSGGGGGIDDLFGSGVTVVNTIIAGNSGWYAGGIRAGGGSRPLIINSTIIGNHGPGGGGGLWTMDGSTTANSIIRDNTPNEVNGNATITYSNIKGGWTGTGNIDSDPSFVDPSAGDYHLQPGSTSINAGNNAALPEWVTTDFEGDARIIGGTVDMGADEARSTPVITFPDANLEAAIREAIGKPTGDIHRSEVAALTTLDAHGRGIIDLTGLEYCTNLVTLNLYSNLISDLSPLAGLTSLTDLNLGTNHISDMSPLANLSNLTDLDLQVNQVSNIAPLAGLTSLQYLFLDSNQISDISPLVSNGGIDSGDIVSLTYNYLDTTEGSQDMLDIQALIDRGVQVYYEPQNTPGFTLFMSSYGDGTTDPPYGPNTFPDGEIVTVTAYPGAGYVFSHWTGEVMTLDNPIQIVMDRNKSLTAHFTPEGTALIGAIKIDPAAFTGEWVTIYGQYRGWEPGHGTAPVTKSDWALLDMTGSIYVTGDAMGMRYPQNLGQSIIVRGIVRMKNSVPYIEIPGKRLR